MNSQSLHEQSRLPKQSRCITIALFTIWLATAAQAQFIPGTNNNQITITGYTGAGGDVIIPSTINGLPVVAIGSQAFYGCTSLTSLTIPNSVTSIGDSAFQNCSSLTCVTIPDGVTSIGSYAFWSCKLTSVAIPSSATNIGSGAFGHCSNLNSALFMGNAPTMGWSVFYSAASGFKVYYFNRATSFTSPVWNVGWDSYLTVNMGPRPG